MVPAWLINIIVIIGGSILAVWIGSTLPEFGQLGLYVVIGAIITTLCVVTSNFPFLLAAAVCYPFPAPVPGFNRIPTIALVAVLFCFLTFFRSCITQKMPASISCNLWIILTFLWVPIRFLLHPVTKFGSGVAGGSGVSGVNAYALYVFAGMLVVVIGCIIDTRQKLVDTMRWFFRGSLVIGGALSVCAFIPATKPFLTSHSTFDAGDLVPGVQRIVALGGYGLGLIGSSLCPTLFRLNKFQMIASGLLGVAMVILGGDRGALAGLVIVVPTILLLRRKYFSCLLFGGASVLAAIVLAVHFDSLPSNEIPGAARILGIFDSKIEKATGGDASAQWRYDVWAKGIERIKESPLTGKGFGNVSANVDPSELKEGNWALDYDVVLAAGLAHNGWIDAAYGFGIPFALSLTLILLVRMFSHIRASIKTFKTDTELSEFHANLVGYFASLWIGIYTAFDLSGYSIWLFVGMGITLENVTRPKSYKAPDGPTEVAPMSKRELVSIRAS